MRDQKFFEYCDYNAYRKFVAYQLEKLLKENETNVAEVAETSKLNCSSIYRYLNTQCLPSLRAGCNVAHVLGVSPTYLFCPNDFSERGFLYPERTYPQDISYWPRTQTPIKYNWLKQSTRKLEWLAQHYNLSKREVAKYTGIPQPVVSRYFNGINEPSLENALEILWLFDAKFEDIWYYGIMIEE